MHMYVMDVEKNGCRNSFFLSHMDLKLDVSHRAASVLIKDHHDVPA